MELRPGDYLVRALAVKLKSTVEGIPAQEILARDYPGDCVTGRLLNPDCKDKVVNEVLADFLKECREGDLA
jgi:hypothetical protein